MRNICKYFSYLTIENAYYLYQTLGLVFYINDGDLIGIGAEE